MPEWVIVPETMTASGEPQQFFMANPDDDDERFLIIALRITGGSDDAMPRRLVGIGSDRASARRSLDQTFSRYDPMGRIIPSR